MKTKSGVKAYYFVKQMVIICGCLVLNASFAIAQEPGQILESSNPVIKQADNSNEDENKIAIRSALRINKKSQRPVIEIIVQSERPFLGGDESFMLHIGKQGFMFDRYGDSKAHILIFELTPQEFEKIKNGDEVTVSYGGVSPARVDGPRRKWKFGKIDKSKLDQ